MRNPDDPQILLTHNALIFLGETPSDALLTLEAKLRKCFDCPFSLVFKSDTEDSKENSYEDV